MMMPVPPSAGLASDDPGAPVVSVRSRPMASHVNEHRHAPGTEGRVRVGVVGMGHVGSSLADALAAVADVVTWDSAYEQPYPDEAFARCALVAVCVDTPSAEDGSCDTA